MREKCPTHCLLFSSPFFTAQNEFKGRVHVVFDVFVFMLVLIVHSLLVCNLFLNIGVAQIVVIIVALLFVVVLCSFCSVFISLFLFSLSAATGPAFPAQNHFKDRVPAFAVYFVRMFWLVLFACVLLCFEHVLLHKRSPLVLRVCFFVFVHLSQLLLPRLPLNVNSRVGHRVFCLFFVIVACVCLINSICCICVFFTKDRHTFTFV